MTEAAAVPAVTLPGGVSMPMIGFGTWQVRGRAGREAMRTALAAGYRHIDTATMYGNEADVGHVLAESGLDRAQVFITTKLPSGRAGRERATMTASLRALGTDHVDLWLVHWPPLRADARAGLAGVPGDARRGPGPGGRGEQLLADPDRPADRGDRAGARGQPDPVEPGPVRPGAAGRAP